MLEKGADSSIRGKAKSCTWRGTPPGTSTGWGQPSWEAACQDSPGGLQVEHELVKCSCDEEGKWFPGLHYQKCCQQVRGVILPPSTGEDTPGVLVQLCAPQDKTQTLNGESPGNGHQDDEGTGAAHPGKEKAQEDLTNVYTPEGRMQRGQRQALSSLGPSDSSRGDGHTLNTEGSS
ncbi:hypothetical protein BTVI_05263 [Pitangus sulphuratus]|nr:hypothetical protein BTVI_05263 [Pitangus sulphuratus]